MPASTLADPLCEECSRPAATIATIDGDRVCPDCAADLLRCDGCAAHTHTLSRTVEDTLLCRECLTGWQRCGECDTYTRDTRTVVGAVADVCAECASGYETCDDCGELAVDLQPVDGGNRVCGSCEDEDYRECFDCFTLVPRDQGYCDSCTDSPAHDGVHDSYYKPEPRFHGDGPLFLGLELEVKTPGSGYRDAVDTAIAHIGDLAYLKEDGSISCGFELVTHPMSYEYALERFPWTLLRRLRLQGCYTDTGVGIHVHVSRAGFSSPAHAYRWLKFVYRNEHPVTTLARRRDSEWAEFSPQQRSNAQRYAKGSQAGYGRYQAINVYPEATFELRIFASSLHPQQVQAALAFAAASVEYTRELSAADIARRRGWEWTAFTAWVRSRPEYCPLLAEMEALACAS
ncbi:hypothetical protein [Nocardia amamiensis]|uniref:hypothetical protein n=1 Tax=Nocardia amamiensis TaxID=404578 RepID=UPI000835B7FD|nr:hypothetical protein [Nocardia amamiensis]